LAAPPIVARRPSPVFSRSMVDAVRRKSLPRCLTMYSVLGQGVAKTSVRCPGSRAGNRMRWGDSRQMKHPVVRIADIRETEAQA
jgi:hypothetical protein